MLILSVRHFLCAFCILSGILFQNVIGVYFEYFWEFFTEPEKAMKGQIPKFGKIVTDLVGSGLIAVAAPWDNPGSAIAMKRFFAVTESRSDEQDYYLHCLRDET